MKKRRQFFKKFLAFVAGIGFWLSPVFSWIRVAYAKINKITLPKNTPQQDLVDKNPAVLDTRKLEITPLEEFKTMGITDHQADLHTWRLKVAGQVESPLSLTYSQIRSLPTIERDVLLICPGFFANNGRWRGISINTLLQKSKVKPGGKYVTFRGPEGIYEKTERFQLKDVLSNKVFLAYGVNGKILPQKHGFPLRVVAEGHYGSTWVKYVHKITID